MERLNQREVLEYGKAMIWRRRSTYAKDGYIKSHMENIVMANLGCQLDDICNQRESRQLEKPVGVFLIGSFELK